MKFWHCHILVSNTVVWSVLETGEFLGNNTMLVFIKFCPVFSKIFSIKLSYDFEAFFGVTTSNNHVTRKSRPNQKNVNYEKQVKECSVADLVLEWQHRLPWPSFMQESNFSFIGPFLWPKRCRSQNENHANVKILKELMLVIK